MSLLQLVRRSLAHYWQTSLLVALGLLVAAGVITGSLVIGDSMRGSLREAAVQRLGDVTHVLHTSGLFRSTLAADMGRGEEASCHFALRTTGSAANAESDATIPEVAVWGVPDGTVEVLPGLRPGTLKDREVALNASLARDLGATTGSMLILTVSRPSALRTDTLFGRKDLQDVTASLRVQVAQVLADNGRGDFRLDTQSARPRNVFMAYDWLAAQLESAGKANTLLARPAARATPTHLDDTLAAVAQLSDYGLRLKPNPVLNQLSLFSDGITLDEPQVNAALAAAAALKASAAPSLIYLASTLKLEATPAREAAYAVIAGVDTPRGFAFASGQPTPLAPDAVWLNEWLAADLQAKLGDRLSLEYLVPLPDGTYPARRVSLRVAGIVKLTGAGSNRDFMPDYPGLTDAETIGNWRPPFPVDMSRITPRDDQYWELHRATPKAFVSLAAARSMWAALPHLEHVAAAAAVQVNVPSGQDRDAFAGLYARELAGRLKPDHFGLKFQPLREASLKASRGTSDFGGLFLGLSMFIVLAGAGLAGTLLRLSLERRATQAGLMLATGLPERLVRRSLMAEGALLTVLGTLLGVPAGVGYAGLLVRGLVYWWRGALGATPALWLHITPASVLIGLLSGLLVGLLTVHLSLRGLLKRPALDLLAGAQALREPPPPPPLWLRLGWVAALVLAVLLAVLSLGAHVLPASGAFFGVGFLLLLAALMFQRTWLGGLWRRPLESPAGLAWRNAGANHRRSLLVMGLLSSATFIIVAVAANTRDLSGLDTRDRRSGAGGYSLVATSTVPLAYDLGTPEGRANLGFDPEGEALLARCGIVSMLASPGEDISCLNLSRPQAPRFLGMPDSFRQAIFTGQRFRIRQTESVGDDRLECLGDADSVMWTLHSGLDKLYETEIAGRPVTLRFIGLISQSLFARELLIDEWQFRRLYPAVTNPSYFLIETPAGQEPAVAEVLRGTLGELGVQVKTTAEVLSEFSQVQNTYLSMFLALGGLGLLLGTLGMIAVILRSALERRGEMALMAATGFSDGEISHLLLREHMGLLLAGVIVGMAAALVAVTPQLLSTQAAVNWAALLGLLAAEMAIGLGSCLAAVKLVLRGNLLTGLRHE